MLAYRSSRRLAPRTAAWIALLAVALLLIPAGLARASGPDGALEGYIRDGTSSAPVAGAAVLVTASDVNWAFQAATDAAGHYRIALPNHGYTVRVSGPAYSMNTTWVQVGSAQTAWNNMSLNRAPSRSAGLQGYVTDSASSAPVTTGQVVATTASYISPGYTNASSMNATGYYHMTLVPGTYQITTAGVVGYGAYTYSYLYPGTGANLWFNVSLTAAPLVAWVNGTVEDSDTYATVAGANVSVTVDGIPFPSVQSDATGGFSIHVPTGSVELTADAPGHAPDSTSVYVSGPYEYAPYLYLAPLSASIRGWIVDGLTGAPIRGAKVVASPFWSSGYFDTAASDGTGYYRLNLTADDFDLTATATGHTSWYSYAFLSRGEVVFDNVTLWPIISRIQGYVLDGLTGAPLSGRTVYAYDSRSGYSASDASDASGFYSFASTPGPATRLAVNGIAPYSGAVAYPNVPPYVTTWVNLSLPRVDAQVDFSVTDAATGLPLSGAFVNGFWNLGSSYGTTDASGLASVGVPSGASLTFYISATGYLSWSVAVSPFSGTYSVSVGLNPSLPTNVTVRGYVLEAGTLSPISSASIQVTGYNGSAPWDYSDGAGYYSLSIVARPQTIRATRWGYSLGTADVAPTTAGTIWVNFTLAPDSTDPVILDFTAIPSAGVSPTNPTDLLADVNETSLTTASLYIYKLWSSAAGVGTFLTLDQIPAASVSMLPTTPGNFSVSSTYATRTPTAFLSDGVASTWWPTVSYYYYSGYQVVVSGRFDNATLPSPVYATAFLDSRSGGLLYLIVGGQFIDPRDQPTATFTPVTSGTTINLSTAAIVGYSSVTGPTFVIGSLYASVSDVLSSGQYAAVLNAADAAGNYASAAALIDVASDTAPPVARAGSNQAVDQGATVTFDGTASTDNVGVVSYMWTFTDGTIQVLYGPTTAYRFMNAGSFLVTLTVRDAAGNSATSTMTVTVRDVTPPTVALTNPSPGSSVSGSIGLAATAADNVGVVRVEFLLDGASLGSATAAPFTLTLDTTRLTNGNHTVEAVAYDGAGNSANASRVIVVSNAPSSGGPGAPLGFDTILWFLLIAGAAAGAVAVLLIAKRRRRPPYASPPQAPMASPPPPPSEPPRMGRGPQGP